MKHSEQWGEYWIDLMSRADGAAFWAWMGPFFASREIERELGAPMYDTPNHRWLIATRDDEVVGFAGFHVGELQKGIIWLDWAYAVPAHRQRGLYARLFDLRMQAVLALEPRVIRGATAGDVSRSMFERYGFHIYQQRGRWSYYQRAVEVAEVTP